MGRKRDFFACRTRLNRSFGLNLNETVLRVVLQHMSHFKPYHGFRARGLRRALLCLAFLLGPVLAPLQAVAEAARMALVVGNGSYAHLETLPNATRDARDLAAALEDQGFEVTLLLDGTRATFASTLAAFGQAAVGAETALFYFSGHGFQKSGVNYLAPVDALLDSVDAITTQTLRLDDVTDSISAAGRHSIILLDACRNNPLPARMHDDLPAGLAVPETGRDTFVAFATQPGNLSYDGRDGQNSPFTRALLRHLATEGQPISQMMIEVRNEVEAATLGQQIPWDQSSLTAPFFFNPLQPTREDLDSLALMSESMQERILRTWRTQGAQIDSLDMGLAAADPTEAVPARDPAAVSAALEADLPDFGFDLIILDETPPADGGQERPITLAALSEPPRDIGVTRALQQLSATDVLATGHSPFIPDAPIAWLAALDPALRAPDLRRDRKRVIGEDVTPPDLDMPQMDARELAMAVQTELQRVGCYRMSIDGDWGPGSRRALGDYLTRSDQTATGQEPTPEILLMVQASTGEICPPPPARVAAPQPARQQRATPQRQQPAAPRAAPAPAPTASAPPTTSRLQSAIRNFR